jgi:hypothetical protein
MQEAAMADPKRGVAETAKVFNHEAGQTVELPEGFRLAGEEVRAELDAMWAAIDALSDPDDPFPYPPPQTITPPPGW